MTSTQMNERVRTLLDEAVEAFWGNDEVYAALTDGQIEAINYLTAKYEATKELPETLIPLGKTATGTGTASLPSDFFYPVSMIATLNDVPIFMRGFKKDRDHLAENTYLQSSSTQPYAYFQGSQIVLETSLAWALDYLKKPSDIASGTNPTIGVSAHNAIVQFAFAFLLQKIKDPRAQAEFNKFANLLQSVI